MGEERTLVTVTEGTAEPLDFPEERGAVAAEVVEGADAEEGFDVVAGGVDATVEIAKGGEGLFFGEDALGGVGGETLDGGDGDAD